MMNRSVLWLCVSLLVACGQPGTTGSSTPVPVPACRTFSPSVKVYDGLPEGASYRVAATTASYSVGWQGVDQGGQGSAKLRLFNFAGTPWVTVSLPHSGSDLALLVGTDNGSYFAETVEAREGKPAFWLHALGPDGTIAASKEVADPESIPSISAFAADHSGVLAVAAGSTVGESYFSLSRLNSDATLQGVATIRDRGTTCPIVGGMAASENTIVFGAAREVVDMGTRRLSVFLRGADGSVNEVVIDEHVVSTLEKKYYCNSFQVYVKKIVRLSGGSFAVLWWDGLTTSEHLVIIGANGAKGQDVRISSDQFAPVSDLAEVGGSLVGSVYQYNGAPDEVGVLSIPNDLAIAAATYQKLGFMSWEPPKLAASSRSAVVVTSGSPNSRAYFLTCN